MSGRRTPVRRGRGKAEPGFASYATWGLPPSSIEQPVSYGMRDRVEAPLYYPIYTGSQNSLKVPCPLTM
jgi:hypothetical protein